MASVAGSVICGLEDVEHVTLGRADANFSFELSQSGGLLPSSPLLRVQRSVGIDANLWRS